MIIIFTMVLQPSMEAAAKNSGNKGSGGKSGNNSSGNSHSNSNKSNGGGSENSNGKGKENPAHSITPPDLTSVIDGKIVESLTSAEPEKTSDHVLGTLLIKFKKNTAENIQNAIINAHGAKLKNTIKQIDVKILTVPENAIDNIQSALANIPIVEYVEKDFIFEHTAIPNDYYYPNGWHLTAINMPQAWDITQGNANTIIAILDDGVDPNHPDLAPKLVPGYNVYNSNTDTSGTGLCGHGTAVAGVAAAVTNNNIGVAGVAWKNDIMPIRITDINCGADDWTLASGIIYAADHGARVANISFGPLFNSNTLTNAAKYMYDKGGWVVVSGGNSGSYTYFSDNPYLITVSATGSTDLTTFWSSYGPSIDFAAPGIGIQTTTMGGSYDGLSGTSFSAPIVAGVAALLFSYNPSFTPDQVYDILKQSAVDRGTPGRDDNFGWGRIDAGKALQLASKVQPTTSDTIPPSVYISNPADGSTISGTITASINATDNVGIGKVRLYIDDIMQGEKTGAPYIFAIDTTKLSSSSHVFKSIAYDISNNTGSSQNTVNTSNSNAGNTQPTVSITEPADGTTVSGKVKISVSASDASGISMVKLYIDGKYKSTLSSPYSFTWNARGVSNGLHTITATAYSVSGNSVSTAVNVVVKN